jgi:hypothetical protein
VLQLDADERASLELAGEIGLAIVAGDSVAYRIRRRDFIGTKRLKHVQATRYYVRLFRPDRVRYERLINPILVAEGRVGDLRGHFDHFPFSKGIAHWVDRHNTYSTLEARQIMANRESGASFSLAMAITAADPGQRRYHQKGLFYRLPCRPIVRFVVLYLGKGGFLDGRAGFTYAVLQAIYEYFIVLKTREIASQERF